MSKPSVLVAIFAFDGWLHSSMLKVVIDIMQDERIDAELLMVRMGPVEWARNAVVKYALKAEKDWIINIDHDNAPIKNPVDLLFMGEDIIYCPTPMIQEMGLRMNCYMMEDFDKTKGLQEARKCGTGCYVISKKAYTGIPMPHFQFIHDDYGKILISEDINFCNKAQEAGFKIYVHTDYPCHHFHELDMFEIITEYKLKDA